MIRSALAGVALLLLFSSAQASTITDISFAIDGSGSMGSVGFNTEKSFVESMLSTGLSPTTEVGAFVWSTNIYDHIAPLTADNSSALVTDIANATYPAGYTYTKNAVQHGIDMLTAGPSQDAKLLVLITDGPPNPVTTQNPCGLASTLAADQITLMVVDLVNTEGLTSLECLSTGSNFFTDANSGATAIQDFAEAAANAPSVPEPGTLLLSGSAALAVALARRRSTRA